MLTKSIPYTFVRVSKHLWRNLKTASSERMIPLVGEALWAANRIVEADNSSDFAFLRYNRTTDGVGQGYGSGYPMTVLKEWLEKTQRPSFSKS